MNELLATKNIQALEDCILLEPQADLPIKHHFSKGLYCREMFIPAGVVLTGKIHKDETLNILAQGTILVISSDGTEKELSAPSVFISPPNTKKAGYAVTDCVFINVHATNETDLDKIEREVILDPSSILESGD
jgi:hypothetical protein